MSHHHHVSALAWLGLAPLATAMLASDLRKRVASGRSRTVSPSDAPVQYYLITATNMFVVAFAWYQVADLIAKKLL